MPISRRSASMSVSGSARHAVDDHLAPLTASSPLMQRMSVLLPEPDGPHDDDHLTRGDLEIDLAQDLVGAVPPTDPVKLDHRARLSSSTVAVSPRSRISLARSSSLWVE